MTSAYKIIFSESAVDLEKQVNKEMMKEWQPIGGLTVSHRDVFYQAMIYLPHVLFEKDDEKAMKAIPA